MSRRILAAGRILLWGAVALVWIRGALTFFPGATGEPRPATQPAPVPRREPYAPPQAIVHAFLFVVALDDVDRLKAWLDDHPLDAPILLKLLESKLCK